jgi:hypothetical protein
MLSLMAATSLLLLLLLLSPPSQNPQLSLLTSVAWHLPLSAFLTTV